MKHKPGETGPLTNYPVFAPVFNSVHAAPRKIFSLILMGLRRLARTTPQPAALL
ncbi:MAG: hypothetical protein ABSH37_08395 [Bryobacteraceae bacterium]|jgi:hypothetical protein